VREVRPAGPSGLGAAAEVRLEVTVLGHVQGVGFRWFVVERAMTLGLAGWVANRPDGGVECVAEGPRTALDELLAALADGPVGAAVDRVLPRWGRATGSLGRFSIRSFGHRGD
jgi:acylphosphatase